MLNYEVLENGKTIYGKEDFFFIKC